MQNMPIRSTIYPDSILYTNGKELQARGRQMNDWISPEVRQSFVGNWLWPISRCKPHFNLLSTLLEFQIQVSELYLAWKYVTVLSRIDIRKRKVSLFYRGRSYTKLVLTLPSTGTLILYFILFQPNPFNGVIAKIKWWIGLCVLHSELWGGGMAWKCNTDKWAWV